MSDSLLEVDQLEVEYHVRGRTVPAVRGVSFDVGEGETLGVVGESGSGKTTIGRAILGLTPIKSGTIRFANKDITRLRGRDRRTLAAQLQVIFQDPYSSLNPALKLSTILEEPLREHGGLKGTQARERAADILTRVGLDPSAGDRYPGSFSGGQRQRIAIARALMASPRLVICDEVVSALDLSIQANVLNLLRSLQDEFSLSYVFIGHDLDVVRYMSQRIIVVYRGRVLEHGSAEVVARRPRHPYTMALVASKLRPDAGAAARRGRVRPPVAAVAAGTPADGCPFAPRCSFAIDVCRSTRPLLEPAEHGGEVACHRFRDLAAVPPSADPDPTADRKQLSPTVNTEQEQ